MVVVPVVPVRAKIPDVEPIVAIVVLARLQVPPLIAFPNVQGPPLVAQRANGPPSGRPELVIGPGAEVNVNNCDAVVEVRPLEVHVTEHT